MRYRTPRDPGRAVEETLAQDEAPRAPEPAVTLDAAVPASTVDAADVAAPEEDAPPSPAAESTEIPPSLYTRFEAFEFLGRGGMGAVYKARDFRLGREVAIKLLFGADPERGGSLLREARSQARITHENVCEVYEAGTADHVRFIVMALIHGEPLDKARAAMTLEERVRVVRQVALALHEAHRIGLVHRDVKPANIMVERGEDGAWKPYIMDFGLAREMGDTGATMTGALMGTPAFMAPEQAAGKVRSLDRRTDVYSLGATLYDILAGRPPIVADSLATLLLSIGLEEPAPIRQFERDVPQDLEAIVMKCLEKQPAARYDSARALGDDLQRFLDGDPVQARRRSLGYVLWKRAKRHKGKVAFASVLLVVAAVLVGAWVRARRIAAEQAVLSRELGESVKEMEFFLRNAQGMPLHDIDRERNIVRERLKAVEATMRAAGQIGVGPGHHALGRGYLALQEPEVALGHLQKAEAAGYRSAGLDYAMGVALSEVYRKELADTKRMEGEQKKQRLAAIEAAYKGPALVHLKAALGGAIEAPAYVEGLIAFYEGRHEAALVKAREAFERAPWLYEAKKLEGDVLFAIGRKYGHDAAFDYEAMSKWFGEAGGAYRVAAEIGSSDPAVHLATCELFTQEMNGRHERGEPLRPSFEEAKGACGRAITASPGSGEAYVSLAQAHASFAWRIMEKPASPEELETVFTEAIKGAEEAARRSPEEPMALYVEATLWRARARDALIRGLETSAAVDQAIAAYEGSLRRDPAFVWALNELCWSLAVRGRRETLRGSDPTNLLKEAAGHCDRALAIEPGFRYAKSNAVYLKWIAAEHRLASQLSPADELREGRRLVDALGQQDPHSALVHHWNVMLDRVELAYALESGEDPGPLFTRARANVGELERVEPSSNRVREAHGQLALMEARRRVARREDPLDAIEEARATFAHLVEAKPWDIDYRISRARAEIVFLRWALEKHLPAEQSAEVALAALRPLLDVARVDPRFYQTLGEIHELRAAYRRMEGGEPAQDIEEGLGWIEKALALHPRMAPALATKQRLLRLRAGGAVEEALQVAP